MSYLHKIWRQAPVAIEQQQELCATLGVSPVVANLLINRGITNREEAHNFLFGNYTDITDPFVLKDMTKAVKRVVQAISCQEKITVYGDYDVDGITSSALMFLMLNRLGAKVEYYIPERESEGYGLNHAALAAICTAGTTLLITVDCGISAVEEIAQAELDIIVTDHHQPPAVLPAAYAIINPKQRDCSYPDKNLAGVGVAFKLCQALGQEYGLAQEVLQDYLDIVALGTIADIVPLVGENHILVKLGLEKLNNTNKCGLQALIDICGLTENTIDTGKVGFMLAPRLNAAGRMSSASAGVELLVTPAASKAQELAQLLNNENIERQAIEREILARAEQTLLELDLSSQKVLVIAGNDWHPGVIGIVASRLVDKYYCPVIMISVQQGIGKGSCRSIPGFDIYEALRECADLLIKFGGHEQAAGLSINEENITALRVRLNELAQKTLTAEDYIPKIHIDDLIALDEINDVLMEQISILEPFGMGNPSPLFACKNVTVVQKKAIGQLGKHLKLKVKKRNAVGDVVAWNMGTFANKLQDCEVIDLAFAPIYNEWLGVRQIQLRAKDIKISPINIIDRRNYNNSAALIKDIVKSGQTIVYVGSKAQAEQVRPWLLPGSYCLPLGADTEQLQGEFTNIVMAALDSSWDSFVQHCRYAAGPAGGNIYLVYGQNDMNAAKDILFNKAPDRQEVGMVYLILKRSPGSCVSLPEIVHTVSTKWPNFTADGVKTCLDIMAELGLLTIENSSYCLGEPPKEKKDIMLSPTFQKCMDKREAFNRFSQQALHMPFSEISSYIKQILRKNQE